ERSTVSEGENKSAEPHLDGIVEISIHHLRHGMETGFAERFRAEMVPQLTASGGRLLGAFVSEHAENTFSRLPVRAGENVFIAVIGFDDGDAHANYRSGLTASPAWQAVRQTMQAASTKPAEMLRLTPTARSLLR
ncbi:MAG: NIPSNAP family protein, partial [Mesorhizobium sp.]